MAGETNVPLVGIVMGSRSDWETMQHAAAKLDALGVAHEVRVVSAHRTPDALFDYADSVDAHFVATGHYARVDTSSGEPALLRGVDDHKDQSYALAGIDRQYLSRMLLPVGARTKAETRETARQLGLAVVADKIESQDICFVPDGDHVKVLRRNLPADAPAISPGPFVDEAGRAVGQHDGYARFTIGQRRGLPSGFREPMYVVAIRPESRAVVIGPRASLLGRGVVGREMNWLVDSTPGIT